MMYLYRRDDMAALDYLSRAFSLSNEEDIECLRLRGQILMDARKFKEARAVFQQALYIVPWDPVCLASLAYCVGMIPNKDVKYKSPGGSVSYHSRLMTMRSFEELIHSRDAEELFEASVTMDLQKIFAGQANLSSTGTEEYAKMKGKRAMNPFSQSNGMVLSNFAVENELEEVDTDFGSNMTGYAYYWYGMHEMHRAADSANPDKARTLFSLASKVGAPNAASSTSAQALYMLGVLAEREEDFETAERHYTQAVQCEPMEPIALLRLSTLVEEGLSNIKKLIRHIENNPRRRKGGKKLKKKSKKILVDSFGTVSTYRPSPKKSGRNSVLVDNLAELLSKPLIDAHEDDDPRHEQDDSDAMDLDAVDALNDYQRRLLMHQRIQEMIVLKKQSYRKLLSKSLVVNSSHHVFVDSYWLERLLHSFSACDDWAMLYRCAQQVKPVKRKAKTEQPSKHK
jgi:tetratricopeptide (TPR) repeat protein